MTHLDAEIMALVALGERAASQQERAHVESCDRCARELESLRNAVRVGRQAGRETLERPDAVVWDRVLAEISDEEDEPGPRAIPGRAASDQAAPVTPSPTITWRRIRVWALAAMFALGAIAGVLIDRLVVQPDSGTDTVARAELDPLPEFPEASAGTARLHQDGDALILTVDLTSDAAEGYREVWLLSDDAQQLVSLGVLTGDSGDFEVPPHIDLDVFTLVDVSDEAYDGDPSHSGVSIVRGELTS